MVKMKNVLCLLLLALFLFSSGSAKQEINEYLPMDSLEIGAMNAVKKAHQMTELEFTPIYPLKANKYKIYKAGKKHKGLPYTSVKETNTFVGMDVSFHTFMTALHNPKSVLYTEDVSVFPYHGNGNSCAAYYGTVCSGLVNYALGLNVYARSYEIPEADYMELVSDQSATGVKVADVLWKRGHVAMVTGVSKDKNGKIISIEICQAQPGGCNRTYKDSGEAFNEMLERGKWKIYRYKYLYKNTEYTPLTEFVAVDGEKRTPFTYNDDICTNKGDKACYISGEKVVLNLAQGYKYVEIYKDSELFKKVNIGKDLDIQLTDLPYGDYMARVVNGNKKSEYTFWKVIDVNVRVDKTSGKVYFSSANSVPVYLEFCKLSGVSLPDDVYTISEEDIKNGYKHVTIPNLNGKKINNLHSYLKVHFECDYGRVINKPIDLKKE